SLLEDLPATITELASNDTLDQNSPSTQIRSRLPTLSANSSHSFNTSNESKTNIGERTYVKPNQTLNSKSNYLHLLHLIFLIGFSLFLSCKYSWEDPSLFPFYSNQKSIFIIFCFIELGCLGILNLPSIFQN